MAVRTCTLPCVLTLLTLLTPEYISSVQADDPQPNPKAEVDRYGDALPKGTVARLGTTRLRRSSESAFTPDGKSIVTFGYTMVRVWDVASGKHLKQFESEGSCYALAVSPDGKQVALSREGGIIIDVLDLASGKTLHHFQTRKRLAFHLPKCHSLVFSADGKRLFTSDDLRGHVWDLTTGKSISSFPHPSSEEEAGVWILTFSADARLLATGAQRIKAVRIWDVATGKMLHELKGELNGIETAAFSPKGDLLAIGGDDKVIELWDTASGKKLNTLKGTNDDVAALAFSPDGSLLAAAANGGLGNNSTGLQKIVLWNVAAGEIISRVSAPNVRGVHFSPDGKLLAWESGTAVGFVDTSTAKHIPMFAAHSAPITAVTYSPDGKMIATGSEDGDIRFWNPHTGAAIRLLRGHKDQVLAISLSPDGKLLASGCQDQTTAVWDVATGKQKWMIGGYGNNVTTVAFSPDGKVVAAGGRNYETVLRDAQTGKVLPTLREERLTSMAVAFHPDGKHLVVGGGGSVRVWDFQNEKIVKLLPSESNDIRSLAISPDGKYVAASGGKRTHVWEIDTGKEVASFTGQHNWIGGVSFSRDGSVMACVSDGLWGGEEYNLHIRDTKTWKEVDLLRIPRDRYTCLSFSPDGKKLAIGTVHAEVLIWKLKDR